MNTEMIKMFKSIGNWLISGDTGISSEYMAGVMLGADIRTQRTFGSHPHDSGDFGRCYRLIQSAPEIKVHLHLMKACSETWKAYIENWDRMTELYEREIELGSSCGLYELMKKLAKR